LARLARGDDVEADDDRLRRVREEHVALGDASDGRVDDADLDLVVSAEPVCGGAH
jgi:hypothetical protein